MKGNSEPNVDVLHPSLVTNLSVSSEFSSFKTTGVDPIPTLLVIDGFPRLNLKRKELEQVFASPRIVQRLKHYGWVEPLDPSSSDHLFPVSRILQAQLRMESGEMPPLLPCELKEREGAAK